MQPSKRYDVFISYRHCDRDAVHGIARRLSDDAGLKPFVDAWNLAPGDRFTKELANALNESRSVAAFKGPEGMSQWVESETELALSLGVRVVPVLLPGATEELPAFLPIRTWVDFRGSLNDPEAFRHLVAGIRGEAPGRPAAPKDSRQYQTVTLAFVAKDDGFWGEVFGSHIAGQGPVRLQLDPVAMRKRFDFARRPTRTVLRKGSPTKVPDGAALTGVGTELYQLLAGSKLGEPLEIGLRSVDRQHGLGVRLLVDTSKAPALAALPWEFLTQPETGLSLASSPFTPIMRWFDLDGGLQSLLLTRPLRLLVVSAAPSGHPPVALANELAQLRSQLGGATLFETLDHATPESLKDALHRHRPNVLHFVGHGEMKEGRGAIVLEAEDGGANPVTGRGLAVLLENDVPPLQLVFLNSCEGGAMSPDDAFGSVAEALVKRHLPAVIAMQFPIPDDAAVALARGFYRDVMEGTPVDAALSSARGVLYADDSRFEGFEWGTPALYVRSPQTALMAPAAAGAAVAAALPLAAVGAPPPNTAQPVVTPPMGLRIGARFFADRWVAISAIAALTASVLTALLVYRPLSDVGSSASSRSTGSQPAAAPPPAPADQSIAFPEFPGVLPGPAPPRSSPESVEAGIPGGVPGGVVGGIPAAPQPPPPEPPKPTDPARPSNTTPPTPAQGLPKTGAPYVPSSRLAIEALLGAERLGGSDVSGTVAAGLWFRDRYETLRPFVRVGVGAAARDEDSVWMFLDAGADVQLSKGFVGGGGGVRTDFSDAHGTAFVRGGLDLSAIEPLAEAQWILEGRWIQNRGGTSRSDYSVLTGIRMPLGR
jgi:CHAT domain/TIR domain